MRYPALADRIHKEYQVRAEPVDWAFELLIAMKLKILVLVALLCCVLHSLEARPRSKKRNRRGKWKGKGKGKGKGKPSLPFKSSIPSRAPTVDDSDDTFLADAIKLYKCNPKKIGKIFREARKKSIKLSMAEIENEFKGCQKSKVMSEAKSQDLDQDEEDRDT